jgi:biopolymer transport protein TolR
LWWPLPASGDVFLGQNKTSIEELGVQVREKLADKPGKTIYVRADARAQYLAVENAIDAVRTAGVEDVGLLTQKRNPAILGRRVVLRGLLFNEFEQGGG